ncbi:MAG: hypothetical protein ACE5JI_06045 [Acidobacteriota bacterium]
MRRESCTRIERSVDIRRPIGEVFAFHDTPENLTRVIPASLGLRLEKTPRDLRPGCIFGYRFRRWPVEIAWEALVSEYRPPERFVNVQSRGYFLQWRQEHHFSSRGSSTRLTVVMQYQMPKGLVGRLVNALFLHSAMEKTVTLRLENVRRLLGESG